MTDTAYEKNSVTDLYKQGVVFSTLRALFTPWKWATTPFSFPGQGLESHKEIKNFPGEACPDPPGL